MNHQYICPHWGQEHISPPDFLHKISAAGYNGIEICLPSNTDACHAFMAEIANKFNEDPSFIFIPQLILHPQKENISQFIQRIKKELQILVSYQPTYINSHTGKDFFSFDDNCSIIEACLEITATTGIRILHETHRGRFSFHAATLLPYLHKFPELELVGDFSHFCVVSESVLQNQTEIIDKIIPHVSHIHARVGFEQGPQVNDPFAPEWQQHLQLFTGWWQQIIDTKKKAGWQSMYITTEFGPAPYMPALPFTQQPIGHQWQINLALKNHLIKELKA